MALFDSLLKKVEYTMDAVNAIGNAANAKGAGIDMGLDPLALWADKILSIPSASVILLTSTEKLSKNIAISLQDSSAINLVLTKEE